MKATAPKKIGVLTGGGDAPGLNAVIRAIVKAATGRYGWEVVGIEEGFEGLLHESPIRRLTPDDVRGLLPRGGSILGCTNKGHFGIQTSDGRIIKDESAFSEAMRRFNELDLDAMVVVGGEGSLRIAWELYRMGMPIVGVPKTIDNDIAETDLTFGFYTALQFATEAIDRLHTTAESHNRVIVVEVMGRHTGWIALESGIAGGADVILIPEVPFYLGKAAAKVMERDARGCRFSIIVVAEGAAASGGAEVYLEAGGMDRPARLGGIGEIVASNITRLTGKETRVVVLGHLQRGGSPTALDRTLASCYGTAAITAIAEGKFGHMVAYRNREIGTVEIELAVSRLKVVPANSYLIGVARDLGISLAGEQD
ncbi:MAG TPA: ATP-dependent 6-phosphofructokinase [Blastocatellia bacterium]|nr:ATP-dependent 6-phosphofructokinase [Blastocatellia bacterium]